MEAICKMSDYENMSEFARTIMLQRYAHELKDGSKEDWNNIAYRVSKHVLKSVHASKSLIERTHVFIRDRKFIPGGRYLYASGRPFHQVQNCLLLRAEDSREGWSELLQKASMALMTGAGIGIDYSDVRANGKIIRKTGGTATGPISLMQMINEVGRGVVQGGSRRSAIWSGLSWKHADVHKYIGIKNWSEDVKAMKKKDFNFPATLDMTNISVQLDDDFFEAFGDENNLMHSHAQSVYWATVSGMLKSGEPGFSVDVGKNKGETLRNACCEITSRDDSDICNLGSINLARISSLEEMKEVVEVGTAFLLAGTTYSDVPYAKVDQIRTKNRRLGLGIMGLHEWLLNNGKKYAPDEELEKYLQIYATSTEMAKQYSDKWELSHPVKTRAIAPVGTIGIVAETTTGIEPVFCLAYKRRYKKGPELTEYQYILDPTAKRLIEKNNLDPDSIEDAYDLSKNVERRIEFQAWVQQYVDHAISSTINLPPWGSELNNEGTVRKFGNILIKYLPNLRGITCYPDGARTGQPLTPIKYSLASKHLGQTYVEYGDVCELTKGGTCGS